MEQTNWESALEAILFALGEPVEEERLAQALACTPQEAAEACQALAQRYVQTDAGLRLLRMEHWWQMVSAPSTGRDSDPPGPEKAGQALLKGLETLALVAYFQPVTRAYLTRPGGGLFPLLALLLTGSWWPCGHLDAPGHLLLYKTTPAFLRCLG